MGHSADVEVDDVADIDDAEREARDTGELAIEQALDEDDGGGIVAAEDGTEDGDGIDDGKLKLAAFARDEVPGSAFGEGL
jgi:hypothetical protein